MQETAREARDGDGFDPQDALAEFAELNRRRLFGSPPLAIREVERWLELRTRLEEHFGARSDRRWNGLERREFMRLPTVIQLEYGEAQERVRGRAEDISQGGLFIVTQRPLEIGCRIKLMLRLPERLEPLEVDGHVAWVRRSASGRQRPGMGVQFRRLSADQRQAITHLVQEAATASNAAV
ncbi:MAG: TIGR02266 family protein [Proteobacteria bacterium]|nr:TIGR02266 family protein [Pseudomonadota bacterium]